MRVQRHGVSTSCVSATVKPVCSTPSLRAQPFQRRIERIEARPLGAKAAVLVARAVALLDAGEMEERRRRVSSAGHSPRSTCSHAEAL